VQMLSREHPALFVVFDLVDGGRAGNRLFERPLSERRDALEKFMATQVPQRSLLRLSPSTRDFRKATEWLRSLGETPSVLGDGTSRIEPAESFGLGTGTEE